jgi:hypothetical protein
MLWTRWKKLRNYMDNNVRKYLTYAVGEIVLVIAGILIALQIDAWYEDRQIQRDLGGQLQGVAESITEDLAAVTQLKRRRTESIFDASRVGTMMGPVSEAHRWYTAELVEYASAVVSERLTPVYFVAATGAYEALEASGNSRHIERDRLKRNLHNYYASVERIEFAEREMNGILSDIILKYQTETTRGIPRPILQEPLLVWPLNPVDDDARGHPFREAYRELLLDPVTQSLINADRNQPLLKEYDRLLSLGESLLVEIDSYLNATPETPATVAHWDDPPVGPAVVLRDGFPEAHSIALFNAPTMTLFGSSLDHLLFGDDQLRINYPGGDDWQFVYLRVGPLGVSVRKHYLDFSRFDRIRLELKRHSGCDDLTLVLKDADDADDGSQANVKLELTDDWATHEYELSRFVDADLAKLNVPSGFLMGASPCSFSIRDIRFLEPEAG